MNWWILLYERETEKVIIKLDVVGPRPDYANDSSQGGPYTPWRESQEHIDYRHAHVNCNSLQEAVGKALSALEGEWHVHVYTPSRMDRERINKLKALGMVVVEDEAGPVSLSCKGNMIAGEVNFLIKEMGGSVLIHPLTQDAIADHTRNAYWVGASIN
jgi:aromatic ring-cleaving dioxygenase